MKQLKFILLLLFGTVMSSSCHKEPIGFLTTEYAVYTPDSLVLKTQLDTSTIVIPNPTFDFAISLGFTIEQLKIMGIFPTETVFTNPQDYKRYKNKTPWISPSIQGLKGTAPIKVEVADISPKGPAADLLQSLIEIRGSSGSIIIPTNHNIPTGEYHLSLRFSNEGWTKERENIFRIIVK